MFRCLGGLRCIVIARRALLDVAIYWRRYKGSEGLKGSERDERDERDEREVAISIVVRVVSSVFSVSSVSFFSLRHHLSPFITPITLPPPPVIV